MLYLGSPGTKSAASNVVSDITKISLLVGCLAFPYGYIYSKNYLNNKYNLLQSLLIGLLISFLTLVSFYVYFAIFNAFSIPVSEAVLGSIALLFISSLFFGIIIFPVGAISGVILYMLLNYYNKNANN